MDSARVWFITGASRGLGRAIGEAAIDTGDQVVATAHRPEAVADLVERFGSRVLPLALDVTDDSAAAAAITTAAPRFGRIDVVVNNAGYANIGSLADTPAADLRAQVETNLFGVLNVVKAVIPVLRAQGSGHIVNVCSVGGRVANPGLAPTSFRSGRSAA